MASARDIRRLALQALYQLDARDGDHEAVRASVEASTEDLATPFSLSEVEKALKLAEGAWTARASADGAVRELAPTWPAERQPAIDRAILRLAHFEIFAGLTPPKVAVNEAVELAKEFGAERSSAFVNGVLDKILKRVMSRPDASPAASAAGSDE